MSKRICSFVMCRVIELSPHRDTSQGVKGKAKDLWHYVRCTSGAGKDDAGRALAQHGSSSLSRGRTSHKKFACRRTPTPPFPPITYVGLAGAVPSCHRKCTRLAASRLWSIRQGLFGSKLHTARFPLLCSAIPSKAPCGTFPLTKSWDA